MFWHKKLKNNWTLLFFSLIALGIILATIVLLIILVKKVNNRQMVNPTKLETRENNFQVGSVEVSARYLTNWQDWQKEWETQTNKEKYLTAFGTNLETMRVPVEKLETHLKVYLAWQKEKTELSKKDLLTIKNQVNAWILELTKTK